MTYNAFVRAARDIGYHYGAAFKVTQQPNMVNAVRLEYSFSGGFEWDQIYDLNAISDYPTGILKRLRRELDAARDRQERDQREKQKRKERASMASMTSIANFAAGEIHGMDAASDAGPFMVGLDPAVFYNDPYNPPKAIKKVKEETGLTYDKLLDAHKALTESYAIKPEMIRTYKGRECKHQLHLPTAAKPRRSYSDFLEWSGDNFLKNLKSEIDAGLKDVLVLS